MILLQTLEITPNITFPSSQRKIWLLTSFVSNILLIELWLNSIWDRQNISLNIKIWVLLRRKNVGLFFRSSSASADYRGRQWRGRWVYYWVCYWFWRGTRGWRSRMVINQWWSICYWFWEWIGSRMVKNQWCSTCDWF